MDLFTILGWVFGFILIIFGIVFDADTGKLIFGNLMQFIDIPSLAITVGGTFAALMISFPGKSFSKIGKHLKICIKPTKYDPSDYIEQIVDFAKEARMKGLLSLEDKLNDTKDEFLKSSLMLVVDSVDPEKVHNLLEAELEHLDDRHAQDREFYTKGSSYAPAFGMIGTLIGLINMLAHLSDPDLIAPAMAVALVTTLYGSMIANLFFAPIANKLKVRHEEEYLCRVIICEGVEAIQAGENPNFIREKLDKLIIQSKGKKGKKNKKGEAEQVDEA